MSKTCNYCGAEMPDSEVTCKKCGSLISGEARSAIGGNQGTGAYKEFFADQQGKRSELARLEIISKIYGIEQKCELMEKNMQIIKNCAIFFVSLAVIGLVLGLIVGAAFYLA